MRKLSSLAVVLLLVGFAAWAGTPVNLKTAIDNQRALAAQRPADAAAQNDLGNLLVLDGDLAEAERAYRRAIELDPQRLTAHFNLGLLQQQRGESRAAMQSFRRVLEIDGRHAWAHYQIGMVYQGWNVDDAAVRAYARAFALDPRLAQASFNPQLIDNPLATRAVLLAFREHASEVQAPTRFEERDRIARLLVAAKDKDAAAPAEGSASPAAVPQVVTLQPSAAPAAAAPASGARTLGVHDLATGNATGQVRSGTAAPNRSPVSSRTTRYPTYVPSPEPQENPDEGTEMEPVEPAPEPPPGPGFMPPSAIAPGVYQPGFQPVPQSSGRLELRLRPLDDSGRG